MSPEISPPLKDTAIPQVSEELEVLAGFSPQAIKSMGILMAASIPFWAACCYVVAYWASQNWDKIEELFK